MKGIVFLSILLLAISMPAHSAKLYCKGKEIDMKSIITQPGVHPGYEYFQFRIYYLKELYDNWCGTIKGAICFMGRSSAASRLIDALYTAIYWHHDDKVEITHIDEAYNKDTILLHFVEQGVYGTRFIRRCGRGGVLPGSRE